MTGPMRLVGAVQGPDERDLLDCMVSDLELGAVRGDLRQAQQNS